MDINFSPRATGNLLAGLIEKQSIPGYRIEVSAEQLVQEVQSGSDIRSAIRQTIAAIQDECRRLNIEGYEIGIESCSLPDTYVGTISAKIRYAVIAIPPLIHNS